MPEASRLRLVPLVHMPLGQGARLTATRARAERAVLSAAASVVTTSAWSRRTLLELYSLPGERVHVAEPGVDAAPLAPGTKSGGALLCVAAVIPGKGHDVLLAALATMKELSWDCLCVGSVNRDPAFVERPRAPALGRRARRPRALRGAAHRRGSRSQLRVRRPARTAVARRDVRHGGHRSTSPMACRSSQPMSAGSRRPSGHGTDGARPGLLVPPDDPAALAAALRIWLGDAERARRVAPRRARAARVALGVVGHDVRSGGRAGRGRRDDRRADPGQHRLARPPGACRRRGALARARRESRAAPSPGDGPPGDPRPRERHRVDGPLARPALAGTAELGPARPGRGPVARRRSDLPPSAADGAPSSSRRGAPTSPGCAPTISPTRPSSPLRRCSTC